MRRRKRCHHAMVRVNEQLGTIICATCDVLLPLGRARDTAATRIELRAAALALDGPPEHHVEFNGWLLAGGPPDVPFPRSARGQAGWLAFLIAHHNAIVATTPREQLVMPGVVLTPSPTVADSNQDQAT